MDERVNRDRLEALHAAGKLSRRAFLKLSAGAAATLAVAGSGLGQVTLAGPARKLTIMTSGGSWRAAHEEFLAKPFAAKHGVEFAYNVRQNAERIPMLVATRNNPVADLLDSGQQLAARGERLGVLEKLGEKEVPNLKFVPKVFQEYASHPARLVGGFVLVFNKVRVEKSEAAEKGWNLLRDSRLKGRIAIPNFGWYGETWLHGLNDGLGGQPQDLMRALRFTAAVVKENGGIIANSADHTLQLFEAGDIWAAAFWNGRAMALQDERKPFDYVYPKGWAMPSFGFAVVANSPNRDLAHQFVNWTYEPETLVPYVEGFYYMPTNTQLKLPPRLQKAIIPEDALRQVGRIDWNVMVETTDRNLELWNRMVR